MNTCNMIQTKLYKPIALKDFVIGNNDHCLLLHDKEERAECRRKNLAFHIETDSYFSTLATVIDLLDQKANKKNSILKDIKEDLLYLQEFYKIVKK